MIGGSPPRGPARAQSTRASSAPPLPGRRQQHSQTVARPTMSSRDDPAGRSLLPRAARHSRRLRRPTEGRCGRELAIGVAEREHGRSHEARRSRATGSRQAARPTKARSRQPTREDAAPPACSRGRKRVREQQRAPRTRAAAPAPVRKVGSTSTTGRERPGRDRSGPPGAPERGRAAAGSANSRAGGRERAGGR